MAAELQSRLIGFFTPVVFEGGSKSVRHHVLEAVDSFFARGNKQVVVLCEDQLPALKPLEKPLPFLCKFENSPASLLTTALKVAAYSASFVAAVALVAPAQTVAIPAAVVFSCKLLGTAVAVAFCAKWALRFILLKNCAGLIPVEKTSEILPDDIVTELERLYPGPRTCITGEGAGITQLHHPHWACSWQLDPNPSKILTTVSGSGRGRDLFPLFAAAWIASERCRERAFTFLEIPKPSMIRMKDQNIIVQEDPSNGCNLSETYWNLRNSDSIPLHQALRQYVELMVGSHVAFHRIVPLVSPEEASDIRLALTNAVMCHENDVVPRIGLLIRCLYSEDQINVIMRKAKALGLNIQELQKEKAKQLKEIERMTKLMRFYDNEEGCIYGDIRQNSARPIELNEDEADGFFVVPWRGSHIELRERQWVPQQNNYRGREISQPDVLKLVVEAVNAGIQANTSTFVPSKRRVEFDLYKAVFGNWQPEREAEKREIDAAMRTLSVKWLPKILDALCVGRHISDFERLSSNLSRFMIQA